MKSHSLSYDIAAVALVVLCMVPGRAVAQTVGGGTALKGSAKEAAIKAAEAKPTPRAADGHPDLNGYWDSPRFPKSAHVDAAGNLHIDIPPANGGTGGKIPVTLPPHREGLNPPPYKPELLAKMKYLAAHEVDMDPAFHCIPRGIPRSGPPRQVVQTPKLTVFLYQIDAGIGDQPDFRLIPTDGRPHRTDVDPSYDGDSVGHWEGDTLIVDVNQLSDDTWLAGEDEGSGYFHSDATHVVERITRKGNALRWEATVEDRNVLTKPWVMTPDTEILTDDMVYEQPICEEREAKHIVDRY